MSKVPKATELQAIADALNERQRAYLLAVYAEDQRREAAQRGPGGPSASEWRWIEYGPVGAKFLDNPGAFLLRRVLDQDGLVDQGTGATWSALIGRKMIKDTKARTGFADARSGRPILSLLLQMTTDGRKVARILKGEPLTKPKVVKPLSLSALRLIAYGQENPGETFDVHAPWGMCPLDWLTAIAICRGLVGRGLLAGDPPHAMKITAAGAAIDVTKEPNWKPARPGRPSLAQLMDM
jgi:hypothetical protein